MNSDEEGGSMQAHQENRPVNLQSRNVTSSHQIDTSTNFKRPQAAANDSDEEYSEDNKEHEENVGSSFFSQSLDMIMN